jgi:arginine-tRNA-protein transferase
MTAEHEVRVIWDVPPEVVVYDRPGECAYLPDHTWRLPLRLPVRPLSRVELDNRLAVGDRRQGRTLYRPRCPGCQACEAIRVDVERFVPGRTQRRVLRHGRNLIESEFGPVVSDPERVWLYNRHKRERGLALREDDATVELYRLVFGETCCDSFEIRYHVDGELIGVAITDRGETALSAVYTYYDPDLASLSPGVFSILRQIELCREWGLRHLYLGLYVAGCPSMQYKARYLPHERLIDGQWRELTRGEMTARRVS